MYCTCVYPFGTRLHPLKVYPVRVGVVSVPYAASKETFLLAELTLPPFALYDNTYCPAVQVAVKVTFPPFVGVRFLKYTSAVALLKHTVEALCIAVTGATVKPHLAVLASSPLVTVHPAKTYPARVGAETACAASYVQEVGELLPLVPPA